MNDTGERSIPVVLEIGQKRSFASALDWPGWSRSGRDEEEALQALLAYAGRYENALRASGFSAPRERPALVVVERLPGGKGTDFGVPGAIPSADYSAPDEDERARLKQILHACWDALDQDTRSAAGHTLRKGPRGGGRDTDAVLAHVLAGQDGYLSQVGWKPVQQTADRDIDGQLVKARLAVEQALDASARGELPTHGPRGGVRWPARYFVRRSAWHILDHAWEIEDRLEK